MLTRITPSLAVAYWVEHPLGPVGAPHPDPVAVRADRRRACRRQPVDGLVRAPRRCSGALVAGDERRRVRDPGHGPLEVVPDRLAQQRLLIATMGVGQHRHVSPFLRVPAMLLPCRCCCDRISSAAGRSRSPVRCGHPSPRPRQRSGRAGRGARVRRGGRGCARGLGARTRAAAWAHLRRGHRVRRRGRGAAADRARAGMGGGPGGGGRRAIDDAGGGKIVFVCPPASRPTRRGSRSGAREPGPHLSVEWARYRITTAAVVPGPSADDAQLAELVCFLVSPAGDYFSGCRFDLRGSS